MSYSGFLANATLQQQTPLISAPPRAPQTEQLNYSNTPQFSTQPINFVNINKTSRSEWPQPIHAVFIIEAPPQDISLIFDTSNSDQLSS